MGGWIGLGKDPCWKILLIFLLKPSLLSKNIEHHREQFSGHKDWTFEQHDIVKDQIKQSYDLILSRHTFQHLKTKDVKKIIQNFIKSGSRFLLATNYPIAKVKNVLR